MSYNYSNNVQIIGRLGAEPKNLQGNGSTFTIISIAENRARFDQASKSWQVLDANWFDVFCFGELETKAGFLKKGDEIKISGILKPVKHVVDGKNISSVVITAKRLWKISPLKETSWEDNIPDFDSDEEINFDVKKTSF